jgi:hypothetical protein
MNENDAFPGSPSGDTSSGRQMQSEDLSRNSIRDAAADARDAALSEAKDLGHKAQRVADEQADKAKDAAASHIDSFADALRAASDELSARQTGPAAEMVAHAAAGLENLSRSLQGKSTGEMLDSVRQFGRSSPIAFLAGSVLAGLALGRFAAAGSTASSSQTQGASGSPMTAATQNDRGATQ